MEFENFLKIGEVSKILGMSPDTLRFFDKEGIAVPYKRDNNYRYYEDWEINHLIEYKKYRGYGFGKKDTKDILYKYSYENLLDAMEKNHERLIRQVEYQKMVIEKNQLLVAQLRGLKQRIGTYSFVEQSDMYYFKFRYNNQYFYDKNNAHIYQSWLAQMPLVEPVLIITEPDQQNYYCGLLVEQKYLDFLNLPMRENILYKTSGTHVNTVIVAGDKHTFSTALLNPAYEFIEAQGYRVCGPVIGYYLARVQGNQGNKYLRYIDIFIPVEKNIQ